MGVSGSFSELVDFKRELERLEVFVEISNLALKQVRTEEDNNPQDSARELDMGLTLTVYGRQPTR